MGKWRRNKIQQDNSRAEFPEPMAEVTVVRGEGGGIVLQAVLT